jgi:hypothetical protein
MYGLHSVEVYAQEKTQRELEGAERRWLLKESRASPTTENRSWRASVTGARVRRLLGRRPVIGEGVLDEALEPAPLIP